MEIPMSIGKLNSLTSLNLSNTNLNGTIPEVNYFHLTYKEITLLVNLEILDLSRNSLHGLVPDISGLTKLSVLDLTSNTNLTGQTTLAVKTTEVPLVLDPQLETSGLSTSIVMTTSLVLFFAITMVFGLFAYKCHFEAKIKARRRRERDDESCDLSSSGAVSTGGEVDQSSEMSTSVPNFMMQVLGVNQLRITDQISKGGFGYVFKGEYRGRQVAVKRLIKPKSKKAKLRLAAMFGTSRIHLYHLVEEAAMMNLMNHPRIVEFIGKPLDLLCI
jgi:hypothetical protein